MTIKNKLSLIVFLSILLTAIPASFFISYYAQEKILLEESSNLIAYTESQVEIISNRFSQSKSKLEEFSRLLKQDLSKPIEPNEIRQFHQAMELNSDGVWRNRRNTYNGKIESGIFLPPNVAESDLQKITHMRIKHAMDYFGAAANKLHENIWYLSGDRSEIIFDTTFPDFAFDQSADNDYTQTPWVTYTSPELNPSRTFIFTPPLFDPVPKVWMISALYPLYLGNKWLGTLGEDMQLSSVLGGAFKAHQRYPETEHFLVDNKGNFILAGHWQSELELNSENSQSDLHIPPELAIILKNPFQEKATLLTESLRIDNRDFIAIGMSVIPMNWKYVRLVPVDNIVKPARQLLFALVLFIFFVSTFCGVLISMAVNKNVVSRIKQLVENMRLYELGNKQYGYPELLDTDEISLAAQEFALMMERIERHGLEIEKAKHVLFESEERWRFALEGSGDGVWDWNIQTDQVIYSKRWKEMLGYAENEVGDELNEWFSRIHPEDMPSVMADLQPHLDGLTETYINEYRMRCKDGNYKWTFDRGQVITRDSAGKPLRIVGVHMDITERKLSEAALVEKEERLQLSLASSKQNWFELNLQTGEILSSPNYPEMLGYDPAEFHRSLQNWQDNIHPDDYDAVMIAFGNCLNSDSAISMEYRRRKQDGGWVWFCSTAEVSERGSQREPLKIIGIHADITERKLAEEKLKLAASVFSNAREGITITDAKGIIVDVNDTFTQTTGYSREEVIGKNPRILKSGRQSPEFYADMWKALQEEGFWYGEVWNRRKSGEVYAEMKTISAVRDVHGVTTHYVALCTDITQMKDHQLQLERIAHYDILTNLPNRALLADRLSQAMVQSQRHHNSLAVVFLDLDGFKHVNDTYGHDVGDELLIALSARMKGALREGDTLARIGGDEFVAVLADLAKVEDCEPVLERLLLAVSERVIVSKIGLKVSASIGVTLYPQDKVDADQLMRHADQAMYVAKESGKNRYHLFDTAQDDAVKVQRENLEAIRSALDNDQFVLYYQPKVNMRTGIVIGVEALIRWQHPKRGLLNPVEFLSIIENHAMSIKMGEWVIDTALTQISQWQAMGLNIPVSISVNIAAVQLQQPDFTDRLATLLAAHPDVEPRYLELEVLETSALNDVTYVSGIMVACMALGVNFALDDFGTGYSSLTYLRRLPASLIKIDQSFVRDMLIDPDDHAIVEGVIALAKSFKREVIAEGVETIEHGTALLQLGCELAQGYGIAKPMPASDIPTWLVSWKPDNAWREVDAK